jgi:hypothetical protein
MRKRTLATFAFVLLLFPSSKGSVHATDKAAEPDTFFREYIGLSDDQIERVHSGKAIAKIMESRTPDEVFVFGSVYIKASPEQYLKFAIIVYRIRTRENRTFDESV